VDKRWSARDLPGVRKSANNLGYAHFNSGDLANADKAYNDALIAATDLADYAGIVKIRSNLCLVWALQAEGGFVMPETPPGPIDRNSPAWQKARMHYTQGVAVAARAGIPETALCDYFGTYRNRCQRLARGGDE
jgi:hypothetical protein